MHTNQNFIIGVFCMVMIAAFCVAGSPAEAAQSGEALFNQHCAACHPQGGNIIKPQKSLRKKDLEANRIGTGGDIVHVMRNPGAGMPKFDEKTVSDNDALLIADYILKTF